MSFQKENISGSFYQYVIRNIPMIIKKISETRFDINYSKLVGLLYEERCKRHNKPIKEDTKKMAFTDYIKTENFMNHIIYYMDIHDIDHNLNDDYKFTSVPDLCEKTNDLFYQEKGYPKIAGIYGPYEFIDYILIDFKPEIIFEYINGLKHENDFLKTRVSNYLNIIFGE